MNQWTNVENLKPNPNRYHHHFDVNTIEQVDFIRRVLEEVYPKTLNEWMEGFDRDLHPDKEIQLWLRMARSYEQVVGQMANKLEVKKKMLGLLLRCSSAPIGEGEIKEVLVDELSPLSENDIRLIIGVYQNNSAAG